MAIRKVKISELPSEESLKGLHTIGVNSKNESVKVSLEFVEDAADRANEAADNADRSREEIEANEAGRKSAEEARAAAEKTREAQEKKRQSDTEEAIRNAENATSAANTAKTNADAATEAAKQATTEANAATENANAAADRVDESITDITAEKAAALEAAKKATEAATQADTSRERIEGNEEERKSAEQSRATAEQERKAAEAAREKASAEAVKNAQTATTNANNATTAANQAASDANEAKNNADTATDAANKAAAAANEAKEQAEAATEGANAARDAANTAAQEATTAKSNADKATTSANEAAKKATDATTAAQTATEQANTAAEEAQTAAQEANTAAQNATTKAGEASAAATNANKAKSDAEAATKKATDAAASATSAATQATTAAGNAETAAVGANTAKDDAEAKIAEMDVFKTDVEAEIKDITDAYKAADAKTLADAKQHAETKIAELVGSAPEALNTLEGIAAKLKEDECTTEAMLQQIGEKAEKTHTHTVSQITDRKALTITLNGASAEGTSKVTYDASTAKSLNITPTGIGAAATGHKHTKSEITDFPTIPTVPGSLKNPHPLKAGNKSYDGSVEVTLTAADIDAAAASHTHDTYATKTEVKDGTLKAGKAVQLDSENIPANADLNNYKTPGKLYHCSANATAKTLQNCPTKNIAFSMFTQSVAGSNIFTIQTLVTYQENNSRKIYQRTYSSDTNKWGDWCRIYTTIDKPTAAEVGAAASSHTHAYSDITGTPAAYTLPTASSTVKGGIMIGYAANGKNYPVVLDSSGKAYVNVPWTDTDTKYTLPKATASVLGGVKIGANISVADDGTISTHAPVTSLAWSAITGKPTIPSAYTLPKATDKALGGIMIGYAANGKNYPVVLDSSGKAYVNVPWTDTDTKYTHPANHPATMITPDATHRFVTDTEKSTWNGKASTAVATQSANGLMSAADKKNLDSVMSQIGDIAMILDNINGE